MHEKGWHDIAKRLEFLPGVLEPTLLRWLGAPPHQEADVGLRGHGIVPHAAIRHGQLVFFYILVVAAIDGPNELLNRAQLGLHRILPTGQSPAKPPR